MTRQEAIAILERLQEPEAWEPQISEDAYTALQMAIDALNDVSDRNVGDTISRQVVLNEIEEWISALYENAHHESASDGKMILNAIKHLPSAQPEPCEDAVSRYEVLRLIDYSTHDLADSVDNRYMQNEIKQLPSVQPKHSTGKWIPVTYRYAVKEGEFPKTKIEWQDATEPDDVEGMKCSECGTIYDFTEARNWCSECGADMREEQDE